MNFVVGILAFVLMIISHEIGHALVAKKDGIFKGFGFGIGGFCCKLDHPYDNRWKYLSGILFSFVVWPLFLRAFGLDGLWLFPILAVSLGALDLLVIVFYGKIDKKGKTRE